MAPKRRETMGSLEKVSIGLGFSLASVLLSCLPFVKTALLVVGALHEGAQAPDVVDSAIEAFSIVGMREPLDVRGAWLITVSETSLLPACFVAAILGTIGAALCLAVPAGSNSRRIIVGALVCQVLALLGSLATSVFAARRPVSLALEHLPYIFPILILVFLRKTATFLGKDGISKLARSAIVLSVASIITQWFSIASRSLIARFPTGSELAILEPNSYAQLCFSIVSILLMVVALPAGLLALLLYAKVTAELRQAIGRVTTQSGAKSELAELRSEALGD
jgi:hypothetical protein